jgi:DNA-binding beta-propeller fold protein YncE
MQTLKTKKHRRLGVALSGIGVAMIVAAALAAFVLNAGAGVSPSGYRLLKRITLTGENAWDYLSIDPYARRVYVTRDNHVAVLDADSGTVVGSVPNTHGVHGVAIAPELGRGFTSNGRADSVTIFDLKTLRPIRTLKVSGKNPDYIVYDRASQLVFTMNSKSSSLTAIRAADGTVARTMSLVDNPEAAVPDGKGHLYVHLADPAEIAVIDISKFEITARIPLAPCIEARGMAMDVNSRRLFSGCSNGVMVVTDPDARKVVARLPIATWADDIAFDPELRLAFAASSAGVLTIVREESPDKFTVVENVPTKVGAHTMTIDPKSHRVLLAAANFRSPNAHLGSQIVPNTFDVLVVGR